MLLLRSARHDQTHGQVACFCCCCCRTLNAARSKWVQFCRIQRNEKSYTCYLGICTSYEGCCRQRRNCRPFQFSYIHSSLDPCATVRNVVNEKLPRIMSDNMFCSSKRWRLESRIKMKEIIWYKKTHYFENSSMISPHDCVFKIN